MPPFEEMDLDDTAVLWAASGFNRYGDPIIAPPVEVPCRWTEGQSLVIDTQGNETMVDAKVVVDRLIPIDSQMWLGTLEQWYGTGSSGLYPDMQVMQVKTRQRASDLKNRVTMYTVGLMRFRNPSASG